MFTGIRSAQKFGALVSRVTPHRPFGTGAQILGTGLKFDPDEGIPVLKLEWRMLQRNDLGVLWRLSDAISYVLGRAHEPLPHEPLSFLRLTLCNHPALPAKIEESSKTAMKEAYEAKLSVAEHTLRDFSEEESSADFLTGRKGVRRAMNRCFLWQTQPFSAMTPVELMSLDGEQGTGTVLTTAGDQAGFFFGAEELFETIKPRVGVPTSDILGGFPVAYIIGTQRVVNLPWTLRSMWPEVVESIELKSYGTVIAKLSPPSSGEPEDISETKESAPRPEDNHTPATTPHVAQAVALQEGRVQLSDLTGKDLGMGYLTLAVSEGAEVTVVVNGIECKVVCEGPGRPQQSFADKYLMRFVGVTVACVSLLPVLDALGIISKAS